MERQEEKWDGRSAGISEQLVGCMQGARPTIRQLTVEWGEMDVAGVL